MKDNGFQFRRAFIEITNACNLSCSFCAVSSRPPVFMPVDKFEDLAAQSGALASVLSLHVLGEPFMHPELPEILRVCSRLGLGVNLVTNGTLLDKFGPAPLSEPCLRQLSFSLHALAALPPGRRAMHLRRLTEFAASKPATLVVGFRLRGGRDDLFVKDISARLMNGFGNSSPEGWDLRPVKLGDKVFLNSGRVFEWPVNDGSAKGKKSCLGLRHHFAVLATGDVVPCCADYDGHLSIGNAYSKPLAEILGGAAAARLRDSIAGKTLMPAYCSTCGFIAPD